MEPDRFAVAFARVLRGSGLDVPTGNVALFVDALDKVGMDARDAVYWAGRATLVRRPEDFDTYDRVFRSFWLRTTDVALFAPPPPPPITIVLDDESGEAPDESGDDVETGPTLSVRYSAQEILRAKDFAAYTADEFDEARKLMGDLRLAGALRPSRRKKRSRRRDGSIDLRRTARRALKSEGDPFRRAFLENDRRPRRIVLLCDVSGSMEPYARALVRFLHVAVVGRGRVEAFALGTRLTRLTRELSSRDPDRALAAAANAVVDWSGGTRLGEGLRIFNDTWGVRGMARGAIVVILSDGWDRGDPAQLAEQMARLHRVAFKVVWVNPLKAAPGYAPLARGMAAALPHVDEFVEGHSLDSLHALAEVIAS